MQDLENVPGLMSILEEKVILSDIAKNNMIIAATKVDFALRNEWRNKLEELKNRDYLLVNVAYFGLENCLTPLNSGEDYNYMRFLEKVTNSYEISSEFRQLFEFDFDKVKELFQGKKNFNHLLETKKEFADFMQEDAKYLVMLKYLHGGIVMDFDKIHEFILIRL